MKREKYYRSNNLNPEDEPSVIAERWFNKHKQDRGEDLKAWGIETLQDLLDNYDKKIPKVNIGPFVLPMPEELQTKQD